MDHSSRCLLVLAVSLTVLSACSTSSISSQIGLTGESSTELRQLPIESKLYVRRTVFIPARTDGVAFPASPEAPNVRLNLILEKAEVDRTIDPGTPLLVDSILRTDRAPEPSCAITLSLVTSTGQSLKLRASRSVRARICAPITIADISDQILVLPKPPVPIR